MKSSETKRKTRRKFRDVTAEESLAFLKTVLKNDEFLGVNWLNHSKVKKLRNSYRITFEMLSLEYLIKILEHKSVKNVYFHPSVSPPGAGVDGIALRYRLYIEYHRVLVSPAR